VLVYAIALLGLNILVGYNGQISLGHGAFYAIGAYTSAILVVHAGVAHWAAIPVAAAICFIAGFLFALPVLRLGTMHLAMATFAVGAVVPILAKSRAIEQWTGGGQGMGIDVPAVPFGLPLSFDQWLYLLTLFAAAACFVLAANLLRGRIGRAVLAIRDDPIAAQAMGIDLVLYKSLVFGVSALLAGIAGALGALAIRYVGPGMFGIFSILRSPDRNRGRRHRIAERRDLRRDLPAGHLLARRHDRARVADVEPLADLRGDPDSLSLL
jgi:branched-chain amino acid transport system permease protein